MNQRAKPGHAYVPTQIEHLANIVTHAVSTKWGAERGGRNCTISEIGILG